MTRSQYLKQRREVDAALNRQKVLGPSPNLCATCNHHIAWHRDIEQPEVNPGLIHQQYYYHPCEHPGCRCHQYTNKEGGNA